MRLQEIWQDIELPQGDQIAVLEDVIARAHAVSGGRGTGGRVGSRLLPVQPAFK